MLYDIKRLGSTNYLPKYYLTKLKFSCRLKHYQILKQICLPSKVEKLSLKVYWVSIATFGFRTYEKVFDSFEGTNNVFLYGVHLSNIHCCSTTQCCQLGSLTISVFFWGTCLHNRTLCQITLCRSKVWIGMKILQANSIILSTKKLWWIFPIKQKFSNSTAFLL